MTTTKPTTGERFENVAQVLILVAVGGMAGAASFTHVHDWTMANSPAGTHDWFGWANAVISELTPIAAGLEARRRSRNNQPVTYPVALLLVAATLSLSAQVAVAKPTFSGWLLSAVPALAFMALVKLVISRTPAKTANTVDTTPQRERDSASTETRWQTSTQRDHQPVTTPAPITPAPAVAATPAPVVSTPDTTIEVTEPATDAPVFAPWATAPATVPARVNGSHPVEVSR